jgi:phosphoadenosine phosphosulfate reductase
MSHDFALPTPDGAAVTFSRGEPDAFAMAVLARVIETHGTDRVALVSSFGAESVVLLHLVSRIDRTLPVLFLDTGMLFAETLAYQIEVAERLGLRDVRRIGPDAAAVALRDPAGALHRTDPEACCRLRKTAPLDAALAGFDAWITGRKRVQGGARATLEVFERDPAGRRKVNPLAFWTKSDIRDHMDRHDLPRHPLVARGYPSIGCAPCTTPVGAGEDERAGRWRGSDKTECGIHIDAGGAIRRQNGEAAA